MQNMSAIAAPLSALTRKNVDYTWSTRQHTALKSIKNKIASEVVLAHYDPKKKIGVAADASAYGIAAVLFHNEPGNITHPVIYKSRTF